MLCILSQASNCIAAINPREHITTTHPGDMPTPDEVLGTAMYILSLRGNQSSQTPTSACFSSQSEGSVPGRMQMETVFEKLVSGTEFQNSFQ